jgi:hypothetical protein
MIAVENPASAPEWPARLRDTIATYFSLEELEAICLKLSVDYEELGEGGKSHKIMGLIRLMAADGRMVPFINHCRQLRPQVTRQGFVVG